ncbi:MAG: serine/threonine-protein kinase, partial [Chloroflexi bacterium]|nr:serine/threonine-protein kinase [Chloroflexota bacterium]
MELSQKEFQFGAAAWAEVTLSNMGSAVATDIVLSFPPEVRVKHLEVDAQVLAGKESRTTVDMECIPELQPQKKKTRLISLTPVKAGHFPLDVRIAYTDALGNRRQKTSALWLNVFKRAEQLPKLPGYAIVWRMSSGEYADVFAAKRQAKDGATVVVKTLRLPAEQASLAMQFLREVRLWGKLSHPNIVRLFEWGDKPFPWMAMEYMEKGTLRKKLNSLSMMESLQIATRLAEALSYAKGAGVTHRDIKPENVLFDHDNNPKLSDWRLAGILPKSSEDGPKSGRVSAYSPPERLSTDFGAADWRTDIYQLGVLLYEMVTGKPPFTGDDEAVIEKIKKQQPRRPSEVKAGVGKHVDPIILKCLAKNRDERYQDALALKEELEKLARIYRV